MNNLRRVLVTKRCWTPNNLETPYPVLTEYEAWFHQFGCDFYEFESGPGNYTTAVVEDDNGNVVTIALQEFGLPTIKFLEPRINTIDWLSNELRSKVPHD